MGTLERSDEKLSPCRSGDQGFNIIEGQFEVWCSEVVKSKMRAAEVLLSVDPLFSACFATIYSSAVFLPFKIGST